MIILKSKTGEIAMMTLVDGADKEDAIRKFRDSHPDFSEYVEGEFDFPENRVFRDAWILDKGKIKICKNKAREIHLDRIRKARNEKLNELDMKMLIFLNDPEKLKEIEKQKQVLRDLPQNMPELNLVEPQWPKELK